MNAYEIATKITMQNGVTGVFAVIGADALKLQGHFGGLQKTLGSINATSIMVAGSLAAIGGTAVVAGFMRVASHGEKLLDQQDKLQRAGIGYNEVLKLQANYYDKVAKSIPTSTASEYLKTYNELRSVVGAEKAESMSPWAMKLEAIIGEGTGKSSEGDGWRIYRALEMKGITLSNPELMSKISDVMAKNIIGSGTKLKAADFEQLAKRGGMAWVAADPKFIAGPLSNVASDLGGSSTGTALMSLYQLTSGATQMGRQQVGELQKLGLLDMTKVQSVEGSNAMKTQPGAMIGYELAMKNPYEWAQQYLVPALQQTYGADEAKRSSAVSVLGRNRNVIRMLNAFSDPGFVEQIRKDSALWEQAHGVEQSYNEAITRNPKFARQAFSGQYESMMQAIGAPMMQAAIPVMRSVTEMFTNIGAFANKNPGAISDIAKGIGVLGVALVGGGAVAILAALGPAGWIAGGVIALAGAVSIFGKDLWTGLVNGLKSVAAGAAKDIELLIAGLQKLVGFIEWGVGKIGGLLQSLNPFSKTSYDGGGGFDGAMVHKASFGGASGSFGGATGGGGRGAIGTGTGSDIKKVVDAAAVKHGVDPRVMYGILAGESLHGNHYDIGDGGRSHGPFQMYLGGGLGNKIARDGVDVRNPGSIPATADWVARYIKRTGDMSPWHGFHGKRDWNPSWGNMGYSPNRGSAKGVKPPSKRPGGSVTEVNLHLDGRIIQKEVVRHMVADATHPTTAPYFNGSENWSPPDQGMLAT